MALRKTDVIRVPQLRCRSTGCAKAFTTVLLRPYSPARRTVMPQSTTQRHYSRFLPPTSYLLLQTCAFDYGCDVLRPVWRRLRMKARERAAIGNRADCSGKRARSAGYLVCGIPVALKRGVLDAVCVAAVNETTNRFADTVATD